MAARSGRQPSGSTRNPKSCHERALGLLAVRQRSRRELELRLLGAGFPEAEVTEVLGRLEAVGLVDDRAFARSLAEHAFGNRRAGERSVRAALAGKGVAEDAVAAAIDEFGGDEEDRALELARARASRLASLQPERAYARLVGLLARRGYPYSVAREAARRALEVDAAEG